MTPLVRSVRRTIRQRRLASEGDRVAIALSGGPDSVALAWLLSDLAPASPWTLAGFVHVNHGLRPGESDADEAFSRALAARFRLPIEVRHVDVRRRARERRQSLESAAREERYACFDECARVLGATLVATGHTRDDQAETVLLRLLRGATSRGLSAIRPRRGSIIRPLIDCGRDELRGYLHDRGEVFRDDSSNRDLSIPRNQLRHTLLPAIVRDWPGALAALARFAELAADDERFLSETAVEVASAVTLHAHGGVQLDVRGLNQLPAALARRIVRTALEAAGGVPSFRAVEAVRTLARADKPEGHLDMDGVVVERDGAALTFGTGRPALDTLSFEYSLQVPGSVDLVETGAHIRASMFEGSILPDLRGGDGLTACLQAGTTTAPFTVRNRRPGDRFRPFGSPGTRKLQDLFVDRKVPRDERDRVPIIVDQAGRIVWVVGVTIAEECRVTSPEAGVVILESREGKQ